jgi:hypothetical protein
LQQFTTALEKSGWQQAVPFNFKNSLKFLSPSLTIADLPLTPHIHHSEHEVWHMVKNISNNQRWVIRFWDSDYRLKGSLKKIYIGSISQQESASRFNLLNYAVTLKTNKGDYSNILQEIENTHCCIINKQQNVWLITTPQK